MVHGFTLPFMCLCILLSCFMRKPLQNNTKSVLEPSLTENRGDTELGCLAEKTWKDILAYLQMDVG